MRPRGVFMRPSQCCFCQLVCFFIAHDAHVGREMPELNVASSPLLPSPWAPAALLVTDQHCLGVYLFWSIHPWTTFTLIYWYRQCNTCCHYEQQVSAVEQAFPFLTERITAVNSALFTGRLLPPWSGSRIVRWFLTPQPAFGSTDHDFCLQPHLCTHESRHVVHRQGLANVMLYVLTTGASALPVSGRAVSRLERTSTSTSFPWGRFDRVTELYPSR